MSDCSLTYTEQLKYLESKYSDDNLYYIKKLIKSNKTIPIGELVERFISVDSDFNGEPWTLLQILTNIDIIVPLEGRVKEHTE